jgi:hypothetical protein
MTTHSLVQAITYWILYTGSALMLLVGTMCLIAIFVDLIYMVADIGYFDATKRQAEYALIWVDACLDRLSVPFACIVFPPLFLARWGIYGSLMQKLVRQEWVLFSQLFRPASVKQLIADKYLG